MNKNGDLERESCTASGDGNGCKSCVNACTSCNNHCSDDYTENGVVMQITKHQKPILGGILSEKFSLSHGEEIVGTLKSKQPVFLTSEDMDAVFAYENPLFVAKCCKKFNLEEGVVQVKFTELKKFLILCAVSSEPISPSKEMDEMWHEFILFTKDYYTFCNMYFGKMIHHQPEILTTKEQFSGATNRYNASREKALTFFRGEINEDMWP